MHHLIISPSYIDLMKSKKKRIDFDEIEKEKEKLYPSLNLVFRFGYLTYIILIQFKILNL